MLGSELVYFLRHQENPWIRIGYTSKQNGREHNQAGFELIGLRPGLEGDEQTLHDWFDPWRDGYDRSTYSGEEIETYVLWLADCGFIAETRQQAEQLPPAPLDAWHPRLMRLDMHGARTLFSQLPFPERLQLVRNDLIHLSSASDEWETPAWLIERSRSAMGSIDTDPASNAHAQKTVKAAIWYHRLRSGLDPQNPWWGNVWLNPPYGQGDASADDFVDRLLNELDNQVTQAITCLNINSLSAQWFQTVLDRATTHAISIGRPSFINRSKPYSSPSKGIILSYFGDNPLRFERQFCPDWRITHFNSR